MSGPPYPLPPRGDANAIGKFQIGVSPIGTLPEFSVWDTVLSQYANSPSLTTIIENLEACLDQTQNLERFYDMIWNIQTAVGDGLDDWGRIVGVDRTLTLTGGKFFGFDEATTISADPFDQSPFFSGTLATSNYILSDAAFRKLIMAKAAANISDGSISSINKILMTLFPNRGNCYVEDNGDMSLTYKFNFVLAPWELAMVSQSGVLPKSTGCSYSIVTL